MVKQLPTHKSAIEDIVSLSSPTIAAGVSPTDLSVIATHCITSRGVSAERNLKLIVSKETHDVLTDCMVTASILGQLESEGYIHYTTMEDVDDRVIANSNRAICFKTPSNFVFEATPTSSHQSGLFDHYVDLLDSAGEVRLPFKTLNQMNNSVRKLFGIEFQDVFGGYLNTFGELEPTFRHPGRAFILYIMLLASAFETPHSSVREFITSHELRGEFTISKIKSELESDGIINVVERSNESGRYLVLALNEDVPEDELQEWVISKIISRSSNRDSF